MQGASSSRWWQVRQAMSDQVCQYLLDKTTFELPERLSERQINQVTMRRMLELYQDEEAEKVLLETVQFGTQAAPGDLAISHFLLSLVRMRKKFAAGVNFRPALPSAIVMKSPL